MALYFTVDSLDGKQQGAQIETLYAAFKAAEQTAEGNGPPSELIAHGSIASLWEIEIEPGVALWQGYQFEPCDGFHEHIAESHGNDFELPDVSHVEAGIVRGINGAVIATYAACRMCNVLKIRTVARPWNPRFDFVSGART